MRIEICGGIGAGKTTLATLLGNNGLNVVLEDFKANPFWGPFYLNPNEFNFETEITFLLQHYHLIKLAIKEKKTTVFDFSFYQDLAYAKMGLKDKRLEIFEDIFNEGLKELGHPILLVCLRCDSETLLKRVKKRGLKEESLINMEFLATLTEDIYKEIENHGQRIVYINSKEDDFASNIVTQKKIVKQILSQIN